MKYHSRGAGSHVEGDARLKLFPVGSQGGLFTIQNLFTLRIAELHDSGEGVA